MRPPFHCVSYELTKRVSRWQRVYSVRLRRPPLPGCRLKILPLFSKLPSPIPTQPFYTWCNMLLTGLHQSSVVSIPLLLPSNSSILFLHFPPLLPSLTCSRARSNRHHQRKMAKSSKKIFLSYKFMKIISWFLILCVSFFKHNCLFSYRYLF